MGLALPLVLPIECSLGNHMATTPSPRSPAKPAMDEWGVYDPEQAGLAALFARLDEKKGAPKAEERPLLPPRPFLRDSE